MARIFFREITKDMTNMKPVAWAIWQPDWPGLVKVDYQAHRFQKTKRTTYLPTTPTSFAPAISSLPSMTIIRWLHTINAITR